MKHLTFFFLSLVIHTNLFAANPVYVDAAGDFTPANPANGDTITWKAGTADEVTGLTFGTDAFESVQAAVDAVDAEGTVFIAGGTYLEGARINITKSLTLQGERAESVFLSGNNSHRVLNVSADSANVIIQNLSIIDGQAGFLSGGGITNNGSFITINDSTISGNSPTNSGSGNAILNFEGTLAINNSTISDNSSGGIANRETLTINNSIISNNNERGISNSFGTLTINHSTISGNSTSSSGGGISIFNGNLTINHSTVSGNSAEGESSSGGGITNTFGTITIINSTISDNSAIGRSSKGGGIFNGGGTLTINNSTISGNSATGNFSKGGGIFNSVSTLTINHTTLLSNEAERGGGIFDEVSINGGTNFAINNSIIARNTALVSETEIFGIYISSGVNFIGDPADSIGFRTGVDLSFASTGTTLADLLNPTLSSNGGPTQTHALAVGSPAIDAGDNNTVPADLTTDQRGTGFPRIKDGNIDIGAVEFCPGPIYVDAANDFTITNDLNSDGLGIGDTVTWKPGAPDEITNLTFGINAFTSIQEAINNVCVEGTVFIAAGTYDEGSEITISKSLTLQGDGATATSLSGGSNGDTTTDPGEHRVISIVGSTPEVVVNDLAIINGRISGNNGSGAGIFNPSGTITVNNCNFSGNSARRGGGIYNNAGTGTVNNCTFLNNSNHSILGSGGGIYNVGMFTINDSTISNGSSGLGGGVCNANETLIINNSTISDNNARGGGGLYNLDGIVTINNSTISGNVARNDGGGIFSARSTLNINNSTISGNSGGTENSGLGGGGIFTRGGSATLVHCTVTQNTHSSRGSGISSLGDNETFTEITSSIISGNGDDVAIIPDAINSFTSGGFNLIGSGNAIAAFNQTGDQTGVTNPGLTPLADNGGPTLTHALVLNSPAVNAGNNALIPAGTTTDQRGTGFIRIVGGTIDIGAIELQNTPPIIALLGDNPLFLECNINTFTDPGFNANDTEDGDTSANVIIGGDTVDVSTPGDYLITYDVTDSFGAPALQVTRTVTVQDTTAPIITLNGASTIRLHAGIDTYSELGASVFDACDSTVIVNIGGDVVDPNTIGVYTTTYDAADASTNAAIQVTRTVNVVAPPNYSITATNATINEGDNGVTPATFTVTRTGAIDRPGSIDWAITPPGTLTTDDFDGALSGTVNFPANSDSQQLIINIQGDNTEELDEDFTITISNALPTGALITTANAQGRILNEDFAPVANDDGPYTVIEDSPGLSISVTEGLLANDTDADDGDGSRNLDVYMIIEDSNHGTLIPVDTGAFVYIPDANFFGNDQFVYEVTDGVNTAQATARIEVLEQIDLAVSIDVLQSPIVAGGTALDVFRVSVANNGPSDATGITLTQSSLFPAGVNLASAVPTVGNFLNGVWTLDLAEGANATLTMTLQANDSADSGALPYAIGVTASDQPDADSSNDAASASSAIISAADTSTAITASPAAQTQSGLIQSKITVTNNGDLPIPAFRLFVNNLPDDVSVFNTSGTVNGQSYLLYNQTLAPGASTILTVEFFQASLKNDFDPQYEIELLPFPDTPVPAGGGTTIDVARMLTLSNEDRLIEITSVPGTTYAIEYSANMTDWTRVTPTITAASNRLQWTDNGPPKTSSHPSTVSQRFYRFVEITQP